MREAEGIEMAIIVVLHLLLSALANTSDERRRPCLKRKRIDWERRAQLLEDTNSFHRCYKMSRKAFDALLALLAPSLQVDEQQSKNRTGIEPITPANKLQMFLRYMSGGSCHDIMAYSGVSNSAFYDCIQEVMTCLIEHPALQIKFPQEDAEQQRVMQGFANLSNGGVMKGCVGAIDGWLCQIDVPNRNEVDKVRPFYSGHYRCHGVNVQACCDHHSRFTSVAISSPGGTGDSAAYREWGLASIVKKLKIGRYIVGDNAYANDNTLLTPFAGPSITDDYRDSYNYHLSQLRIRIEMAFGLLVRKWRIFRTPLQVKFANVSRVVMAGCILHNWCIDQRLADDPSYEARYDEVLVEAVCDLRRTNGSADESDYRQLYLTPEAETRRRALVETDKNLVRNAIVSMLRRNTAKRPQRNIMRRARMDAQL